METRRHKNAGFSNDRVFAGHEHRELYHKGHAVVRRRLAAVPMDALAISSVTEGELRYGVARPLDNTRLKTIAEAFRVPVSDCLGIRRRRNAMVPFGSRWRQPGPGLPI